MKTKMKQYAMTEPIQYWSWINSSTLAIVTQNLVYHWSMEGTEDPKKVFEKHSNFENATIINYRVDKSEKWLLLIGLKRLENGFMQGVMQLYSVEKSATQAIEGHAAAFMEYRLTPTYTTTLICIAANTQQGGKLFVMEVPTQTPPEAPKLQRRMAPITFPVNTDFPVALQVSEKHGIIYMITKAGFLFLYEASTATLIYKNRISAETIFITAPYTANNGLIGINKSGQVLSVSIDDNAIVPYLTESNPQLAIQIASYANLGGADDLYIRQFNQLLQQGDIENAVKVAATSPQGILRTQETIQKLKRIPVAQGQKNPLAAYFQAITDTGKLNTFESVELAQIVLQKPQGVVYIEKLMTEDKIEGSETLGDIIQPYNPDLALKIYLKGQAHDKIIENLLRVGDHERVLAYCEKVGYNPEYLYLFRKLVQVNRDNAVKFAARVYETKPGQIDPNAVVDIFVQNQMIKQATAFLLEILKDDKPEDADLQTKLLDINLMYSPIQVADSILGQNMFSHFNKQHVAQMCEKVGLFQRALENYTSLNDRKRVIVNTQFLNSEWLISFFGNNLSQEETYICLRELLQNNLRQNLNLVVEVAHKFSNELGPSELIRLFEDFHSYDGVFYYLSGVIDTINDPDTVFKYIDSAVKIGQLQEVERITHDNNVYDGFKVKEYLKSSGIKNQNPLINVCDKHGFVEELVHFLYSNKQNQYIESYIKTRNPLKTPQVVGALLDADASEDYVVGLLMSVGNMCPIEPLVVEIEKRNRLKILKPWLEARVNEGTEDPAAHNAIAKIYIDTNNNPEQFIRENQFYDSRVVGKYCEKRDPHLSFIAYERGQCDEELVQVTVQNSMFKQLARYLVRRQDDNLWRIVLNDYIEFRRPIIDQVVQTALPECQDADEVSSTVRAFMAAGLPNELIELLEQIVLYGNSNFKSNKSLQNLLILTAIKEDTSRVRGYLEKLDLYDGPDIAQIAIEKKLYEEAFYIYNKFGLFEDAIGVLIKHIGDLERASEFADNVATPQVWSLLGSAQLNSTPAQIPEAIESFMKANDSTFYRQVIFMSENGGYFNELIKYLLMARQQTQDSYIDTELVYSYAKASELENASYSLADLEDFISGPNIAQLLNVGEKCFDETMYEAARIIFAHINNYSRLASALIKLGKYRDAVAAAGKANSIKTWKEVMVACIEAKDFRYAQSCGLNIIIHADELDELIYYYESRGYFEEVIALLEKGLGLEGAHKGIFTSLALLYAKYKPEKMMDHITRYYRKCFIQKLLGACEQNELWAELCFLYRHSDEFDLAIKTMIDHPVEAWDHAVFTDTIRQVVNMELYYRSIQFYLEEHSEQVIDLLHVLTPSLDHERVAREVEKLGDLPLIKDYLESVQDSNLKGVNDALHKLYIEEEDFETLRASIEQFRNFDQIGLAKKLEKHELLEFRRISAWLYRVNKKYLESISLSKQDKLFQDAMDTAAESKDRDICEGLLKFFVEGKLNSCFSACLYNCYSFIRPDVALELAWRNGIQDMVMPYMIQVLREYTNKVDQLTQKQEQTQQQQPQSTFHQQEELRSEFSDPSIYYSTGGYYQDPNQVYAPQQGYPQQPGFGQSGFLNF